MTYLSMNWHRRRLRWYSAKRFYYRRRHGVRIALDGSMMPQLGRGKYVSVRRRGAFLDITDERTGEMIRLIPYQPNHGVMVEYHPQPGKRGWRTHCDFRAFRDMGSWAGEAKAGAEP